VRAVGSVVVDAPAEQIVDFVLDPVGYPQADTKIRRIDILERGEGTIVQRVRGCMRWRALGSTLEMVVRPQGTRRIDIDARPQTISFPARLALAGFHGEFTLEPVDGGVLVTHVEDQQFRPTLAGRVAERLCAGWLQRQLAGEEMPALKRIVEARRSGAG
jgi:hypothetical protein